MANSIEALLRLLRVERLSDDLYHGEQPPTPGWGRMFGGQVLAQSLAAAYQTVPGDRRLHSLHSYFILPGDTTVPITFDVQRLRDGRSFTTRRTAAIQQGRPIFYMTSSYQVDEPGPNHQDPIPSTPADPSQFPRLSEYVNAREDGGTPFTEDYFGGFEVRVEGVHPAGGFEGSDYPTVARVWIKIKGQLPDEAWIHDCTLAYISDMTLLSSTMVPHDLQYRFNRMQTASLDHAMWFHRPFNAGDWLLYDQATPSASNARGLSFGRVFDQDGRLVATAMQEGLVRPVVAERR